MSTYKEQKEKRRPYVLLKGNTAVGVFGNLRGLCEHMKDQDFPSYWTLTRKKEDRMDYKEYSVQRVKHF